MRGIEARVGPAGFVDHLPIDEDLIASLTQRPRHRGLIDRAAVVAPADNGIGAADENRLVVVGLEDDRRAGSTRVRGRYGFVISAGTNLDVIARLRDRRRVLDCLE